jgi:hypothetical protein
MFARLIELCSTFLFASVLTASPPILAGNDGIITVKSTYSIGETVERLKKDIAGKGIKFFDEIDQSKLAAAAGIDDRRYCWSSETRPLARNSSPQTPMPGSIGQCGFSFTRTRRAKYGPSTLILTGSRGGTGSKTARTSSRWHRASSPRSRRA